MRLVALLALVAAAGCIAPEAVQPAQLPVPDLQLAFEVEHDHEDPPLHAHRWGAQLVATLAPALEDVGHLSMGEIDLSGDLAYVSVNGEDAGGAYISGFLVVDVADPRAPRLVHFERAPEDALCAGDVKAGPGEGLVVLATQCGETVPSRGFVVYDVTDPAAPRRASMAPPGTSCHMADVAVVRGDRYVYCAGLEGASAWRLVDLPGQRLWPVLVNPNAATEPGMLRHAPLALREFGPVGAAFLASPHDMTTQADPLTGEPIVVVSHGYAGVRILDGSDPARGRVLGAWAGEGSESFSWIHTAHAVEMDGRRIVVAITENVVDTPPRFWVLDFTDYASPVVLAEHRLAAQESSHRLAFSLHNFQVVGRTLYIAAYHAGVWALDLSDATAPREVGLAMSGAPHPFEMPEGSLFGLGNRWNEQVWDVVVKDGYVLASDMASGLHVYAFDGEAVGDPSRRSFG